MLFITPEFPPIFGGTGTLARDLAAQLSPQHSIHVLTAGNSGDTRFEDGYRVTRLKIPFKLNEFHDASALSTLIFIFYSFYRAARLCRKEKFNLIHGFEVIPSGLTGVVLGKLFNIPTVVTAIGAAIYDPHSRKHIYENKIYRKLLSWVLIHSVKVTSISGEIKKRALEYRPDILIEIIPPGIKAAPPVNIKAPEKKLKILTIARLSPRKGLEVAIKALSGLEPDKYQWTIVGDGPSRKSLNALILKLGLQKNIRITGFVDEDKKQEYLRESNLFLLTSYYEGFGIVYLEAMDWGLPIICGNQGGQTDFVRDPRNGILVSSHNSDEILAAVRRLDSDRLLMEQMGNNNKEDAKKYYHSKVAEKYLNLYQAVVGKNDDFSG